MAVQYRGSVKELFSGILNKCGGKRKSWNKRFFILKDDYCLYYYKDTSKGHLGAISLRDTKFKVRKGEASDVAWPRGTDLNKSFVVVTNQRTYCMFAPSQEEAEVWIRMLQGARDKLLDSLEGNRLHQGQRAHSTSALTSNGTEVEGLRPLSDTGRPISDITLDVPHPPNKPERQLTYEEMKSLPSESLTNETDSFYDLAQPDQEVFVEQQLYIDIEDSVKKVKPPKLSESPPEAVYAQATAPTEDTAGDLYEEVAPDVSIKSQPLPPLPSTKGNGNTMATSQAIYEDVGPDDQPLYECVAEEGSKVTSGREAVSEIEESGEFTQDKPPPLPPKDDLPPLPPRNDLPPLPPKDPSPPLPPKDADSPQFPKRDESSPLPPKDSPKMEQKSHQVILPPLPPKDDESNNRDNYYDDVEAVINEVNKLQLSELDNGSPPMPHKANSYQNGDSSHIPPLQRTPPSPRTSPSQHTPPSPRTSPSQHTPPSPRTSSLQGSPPSYHTTPSQDTPPSQLTLLSQGTPPSPHRPLTPPTPRTRTVTPPCTKLSQPDSPPSPHTPPSPHKPHTPPSPHKPHTPPSPQKPHTPPSPHKPHTPPSPHKPHTSSSTHTPPHKLSSKPSPTPRRRPMNISAAPKSTSKPPKENITNSENSKEEPTNVTSPLSPDRGRDLFRSRQERLDELSATDSKRRADTIQLITTDSSISSTEKVTFARTLREVEQERLAASEEKFRWERERMKFVEERRKFEQERKQWQEQLEAAKKQTNTNP